MFSVGFFFKEKKFMITGLAGELKGDGIAVNALWPLTAIETSAMSNVIGTVFVRLTKRHEQDGKDPDTSNLG